MNLKNIPLDFADKLTIVGERLNDYIAKDMGTEIYDIVTEIVAPLTYDKSDIELILNDGWKSFNNYTLKNYYWGELEVAYDELIPKSIKDEISKIDNNVVKDVLKGKYWDGFEWEYDSCQEVETKIVTLVGARYYSYFYKENRHKLEPLLDRALIDFRNYHWLEFVEAVRLIIEKEVERLRVNKAELIRLNL